MDKETRIARMIENEFFSRHEGLEPFLRKKEEFPQMTITERPFASVQGTPLMGYHCSRKEVAPKAVLVLAHGLGIGGAFCYLDVMDYFASQGFLVFAYDATGHAQSGGSSVGCLEQGVADLSQAIAYVENDSEMGHLPLVLWGHSWGAYAVSAVLSFHPEVRAVCEVAGFNDVAGEFHYQLETTDLPKEDYPKAMERLLACSARVPAPYRNCSALEGFAHSRASVFLLHGGKDVNVPDRLGYDLYQKAYGEDPRFVFAHFPERAHFDLYDTDAARKYRQGFDETRGFENYEKSKACELDYPLLERIRDFFLAHLR